MEKPPETTRIHLKPQKSKEKNIPKEEETNKDLQQKFKEYVKKRRIQFLKKGLSDYYGKNFVVEYQPRFNFQEQWQEGSEEKEQSNTTGIIEQNFPQISSSLVMLLIYFGTIWISMIDLVFRNKTQVQNLSKSDAYQILYWLCSATITTDLVLKVINNVREEYSEECLIAVKIYFKSNYQQVYCLVSCSLKLIGGQANSNSIWCLFQIIAIYFLFLKMSKLYKSLRLLSFSLYYEYQSKISDLIITLFFILNLNAIVLFTSTFFGYSNTWIKSINISHENEFVHYLYSLYYSSTTILTVGYGDISPKNPLQVGTVVFIQVLGIATLGYIISQIGYCISNLRKERQIIQKDLSTMLKMKKHYNMDQKIVKQAQFKIINNTQKIGQLYPSEENQLMNKFTQEFRNNLQQQNALSVVKSCIFFLTRWSINFQKLISQKIEHTLFNINDLIYQPKNKKRIYIIKSGSINIYADKNGRKRGEKNLLKKIQDPELKEIGDNCYGYTAMIANKQSNLYAIANGVTSAYYLDKEKFEECFNQKQSDFQYYHEIKAKLDQSKNFQVYQVPSITNSKNHYSPTQITVIRKKINQSKIKNKRGSDYIRKQRYCRLLLNEELQTLKDTVSKRMRNTLMEVPSFNNLQTIDPQFLQNEPQFGTSIIPIERQSDSRKNNNFRKNSEAYRLNTQTLKKPHENLVTASQSLNTPSQTLNRPTQNLEAKKAQLVKTLVEGPNIKQFFSHFFDKSKEYSNYFPKKNILNMVDKYELEYVLPQANSESIMLLNNQIYRSQSKKL